MSGETKPIAPKVVDPRTLPALAPLTGPQHVRWCGWKYELNEKGKWTKPPYQANGYKAKNNTPATWSDFDAVWQTYQAGGFDGIGIMLLGLGGVAAIDLDKVREPNSERWLPWTDNLISACASYTETTPSTIGKRIIGGYTGGKVHRRGEYPSGGSFELFADCERFITVTGLADGAVEAWSDITPHFEALLALLDRKPNGHDRDGGDDAEIDIHSLPLLAIELIISGTIDGKKPRNRGPAFAKVVREIYRRGHSFRAALGLLSRHPNGICSKYEGRLEAELRRWWSKLDRATTARDPAVPLITVEGGKRDLAADKGIAALIGAGVPFYQRNRRITRIALVRAKASDGAALMLPGIIDVDAPLMERELGRCAQWRRWDARTADYVFIDPPGPVSAQILSMSGHWPFAPLHGIIQCPTLRGDGSLLNEPGYDARTGLVLVNSVEMRPIGLELRKEDAEEALDLLLGLLTEFPFSDKESEAVALSMFVTPVIRGAMAVAPMHLVTKPLPGTGASYLADCASMIATGEVCAVETMAPKYEETEKRLVGTAIAGHPIIALDNARSLIAGDFFCQVVERPLMSLRALGSSDKHRIPNTFTLFANGNNAGVAEDMVRRTIRAAMDANTEHPEKRIFTSDPLAAIQKDRGKYVRAALTIPLAYIAENQPNPKAPLPSFGGWSRMVRDPLVWLGCADPVDSQAKLRIDDPRKNQVAEIFAAWASAIGRGFDSRKRTGGVIKAAESDQALLDALHVVAAVRNKGETKELDPRALGNWLRRHLGHIAGGLKLLMDTSVNASRVEWYLEHHTEQTG
jgi:hypothetical protein